MGNKENSMENIDWENVKKFLLIMKKWRDKICEFDVDEYVGVEEDRFKFDGYINGMIYEYMDWGEFCNFGMDENMINGGWIWIGEIVINFIEEIKKEGFVK